MNEFDKELDTIIASLIEANRVASGGTDILNEEEVAYHKKRIKQAIEKHVIGEDIKEGTPWDLQWEGRKAINLVLEQQRQKLK